MSIFTRLDEKGIKYLFEYACDRQPSIIFIDDIDILSMKDQNAESETSRRLITELFVQMTCETFQIFQYFISTWILIVLLLKY